jgi:hypothetical protein
VRLLVVLVCPLLVLTKQSQLAASSHTTCLGCGQQVRGAE